jgi:hypothetical protein
VATWDRFKNNNLTGLEITLQTGGIWLPRAYCDDPSATAIYSNKAPVCKLKLIPRVQNLGSAIAWDISQSMSSTSTIDTFSIDWGGTTDIGDITGDDWATDPLTGNVVYSGIGRYTVEAYVTDLLGVESQHVLMTVRIVTPGDTEDDDRIYIGTSDSGVFLSTAGSTPAASNSGLSGDDLKLRSIRLNPFYSDLAIAHQHVVLATKTGLAYSVDGGVTWTPITEATLGTPANTAGDSPAPAAADPDNLDLCFDPQDSQRVYVLRYTTTPQLRAWLYKSDDYMMTWGNTEVGI